MPVTRVGGLLLAMIVAIVATGSASCAHLVTGPPDRVDVEQELRQLEGRLREAALTRATRVLDDLLADDYVNIDAYGLLRYKNQVLADVQAGNSSFEVIDLDDITVNVYGDAAVLTATRTVRGSSSTRGDPTGQFRQIRVFAKRQGRWRAVMLQVTRIAQR
jgi:hypothetical protein